MSGMKGLIVVVVFLLLNVYADDQIYNLPGITSVNFKQYAGYVNVNQTTGRNLFYWFTESQTNPANAPVVLWLNGGPGCSSLGGFFEELGPFTPRPTGNSSENVTLDVNPYSWNTVANVVFLESPSGVGFSYSTDTNDYTVGDVRTANDTYTFLLKFFQLYPQFSKNPFWVTGESYGGHYVPTLSARIVAGNQENPFKINFQGFMVGNAWTDATYDNYGALFDWYTHSLISRETFEGAASTCDFGSIGPLSKADPAACEQYLDTASNEMGNIDIYQIYADVCLNGTNAVSVNEGIHLMKHLAASDSPFSVFAQSRLEMEPCEDGWLTTYLNQADVKKAIHAVPNITWEGCSSIVNYSYSDLLSSMLPVYQGLLTEGITMVVYSGDIDGIVPTPGTKIWLDELNLTIAEPWRPWIGADGQVAGYTVGYKGLTFLTVRGAGHMVPGTQPLRALNFFERILSGKPL